MPLTGSVLMIPEIIVVSLRSQNLAKFCLLPVQSITNEILRFAGNKIDDFVKDTFTGMTQF